MSCRAHKDPCGIVGCPQFLCMDASKDLRAEVEALKAVIISGWGPKPEHVQRAEKAEAEIETLKQEDSENLKILFAEREGRRKAEAENAELKAQIENLKAHDEAVFEALKDSQSEQVKAAGQKGVLFRTASYLIEKYYDALDELAKKDKEALALALECKEKTEALERVKEALRPLANNARSLGPNNAIAIVSDALSRPASFWTRKSEAMGKELRVKTMVLEWLMNLAKITDEDLKWAKDKIATLDSIREDR